MMRYYHGGVPGLREEILPPDRTKVSTTADYGAQGICRRDRVYLTTDPQAASIFAAAAPSERPGWIYEVDPFGDVEPDTDWHGEDGVSVCARRARIRRVYRRLTLHERMQILRVLEIA